MVVYFRIYESDLIRQRKAGRLKRRRFWAAGVNDLMAVDQHDKWKRFGLALHTGIDPFPGRIHWIKVWWTNSNPKLILSYYLEFVEKFKRALRLFLDKIPTHLLFRYASCFSERPRL